MKVFRKFTSCMLAAMVAMLLLLTACSSDVTITAKANNASYGTVSGGGSYSVSSTVTVKATPKAGYRFTGWEKDGKTVSTSTSYSFTAANSCTVTAVFVKNPVVTVNADAADGGTVTGGGSYAPGSSVTVTATQKTGYVFRGWLKDGKTISTDTSYTFTVTADCTLTASFTKFTYEDSKSKVVNEKMQSGYTVDADVSYAGISMKAYVVSNGSKIYEQATALNKTVTAIVDGTKIYLLNDSLKTFAITTEAPIAFDINSLVNGNVASATQGETTVSGTKYYSETLVLKSDGGTVTYCFDSSDTVKYVLLVIDDEEITVKCNSLTFTYDASKLELAGYDSEDEDIVTVSLQASPTEGGAYTGDGAYTVGDSATVVAVANDGYTFSSWQKDGTTVSTSASYTFKVTEECTLTAVFCENSSPTPGQHGESNIGGGGGTLSFEVTVEASPAEGGTVTGGGEYESGDSVTVKATANSGYAFKGWQKDGETIATSASYTFEVSEDCTLTALFEKEAANVTVTVSASPAAGGTVTGGGTFKEGTSVTVKATVNTGYTFTGWQKSGKTVSTSASYTFNAETCTLTAVFEKASSSTPTSGITWVTNSNSSGGVTLVDYTVADGVTITDLVLPSQINGKAVTAIVSSLFKGNTTLTSVTIPSSVKTIGAYAFQNCTKLTTVTLSKGLESIGNEAFSGCKALTTINFPEGLQTIGNKAFYETGITKAEIPASVTSIGDYAFYNCDSLKAVTIEGKPTLGINLFYDCDSLISMTFAQAVEAIPDNTFYSCDKLSAIDIPEGTKSIGRDAFAGTNLMELVVPASVTTISRDAFHDCNSLTSATLKGNLTLTEDDTGIFYSCDSLKTVTFGGTVSMIPEDMFAECKLTAVTLPESVTRIGNYAFYRNVNLKEIVIPANVTTIDKKAFQNNSSLQTVTIKGNVTTLGEEIFDGCSNLKTVTFSGTMKEIPESMFKGCNKLASITLPKGITSIGDYAFYNTGLTSITIPETVTTIGDYAFNGTKLTEVTIPNSVTSLGNGAFSNCTSLKTVKLSTSMTMIGGGTFYKCYALTSVTIPESIKTIGNSAFDYCTSLTTLDLPEAMTSIGSSAFSNCTKLQRMILPEGITKIDNYTFYGCTSLKYVYIPASVKTISSNAFESVKTTCTIYYAGTETQWNQISGYNDLASYTKSYSAKRATVKALPTT